MEKHCPKCDKILCTSNFSKNKSRKDGYQTYCKNCSKLVRDVKAAKEYYADNKEYFREKANQNRAKNKDEINLKRKLSRKNNIERRMLSSAKERAKRKGLEFNIELSDIIVPEYCPMLGIKLFKSDKISRKNSPSLDRIDSSKGYVKGNVQVISNLANTMKNNATIEELVKFSEYVLKQFKEDHVHKEESTTMEFT